MISVNGLTKNSAEIGRIVEAFEVYFDKPVHLLVGYWTDAVCAGIFPLLRRLLGWPLEGMDCLIGGGRQGEKTGFQKVADYFSQMVFTFLKGSGLQNGFIKGYDFSAEHYGQFFTVVARQYRNHLFGQFPRREAIFLTMRTSNSPHMQ
jgi:hypothetical protein